MPLLTSPDNKKVFFIHIPRTAGRALSEWFVQNNFNIEHYDWNHLINDNPVGHLCYPDYNLLPGVKDVFKFAVVRDPLDRFTSMCRIVDYDFSKIKTKEDFKNAIEDLKKQTKGMNWFTPQHYFIDKKTVWWKLEDRFERVFVEWLALPSYGNVKLEGKIGDYPKEDYDRKPLPLLSMEVKNLVKEYYKEDYERFNYEHRYLR